MSRVYNFSAGPAILPGGGASGSAGGDDGLSGNRNVGDGDEPSLAELLKRLSRRQKKTCGN